MFLAIILNSVTYCLSSNKNQGPIIEELSDEDEEKSSNHSSSQSSNKPLMKFKLGFEFQDNNGLCPRAEHDFTLQKKSIFRVTESDKKDFLWKIVFDATDIEFVTKPFSYQQKDQLKISVETISKACKILERMLNGKEEVNFCTWTQALKGNTKFKNLKIIESKRFKKVADMLLESTVDNIQIRFTPQATIQHSLEFSIPLYFGLFGFNNLSGDLLAFSSSLPMKESFLKSQSEANFDLFRNVTNFYSTKLAGLIFLHAQTIFGMTPREEKSDTDFLKETLQLLTDFNQVDPKIGIKLMSRRPFSSMYNDIAQDSNYKSSFLKLMAENASFREDVKLFNKTNYAEQFFHPETGGIISLEKFASFLKKDFYEENKTTIDDLLRKGVISTAMIRNLQTDGDEDSILTKIVKKCNNYLQDCLESVSKPRERVEINLLLDTFINISSNYKHDVLSPPHFLEKDNAMGFYKNDKKIDKKYGEAIIEIRNISNVQSWFLKKCGLNDEQIKKVDGDFMKKAGEDLKYQPILLFDFLNNFGQGNQFQEIYGLGMSFAVRRF